MYISKGIYQAKHKATYNEVCRKEPLAASTLFPFFRKPLSPRHWQESAPTLPLRWAGGGLASHSSVKSIAGHNVGTGKAKQQKHQEKMEGTGQDLLGI